MVLLNYMRNVPNLIRNTNVPKKTFVVCAITFA